MKIKYYFSSSVERYCFIYSQVGKHLNAVIMLCYSKYQGTELPSPT